MTTNQDRDIFAAIDSTVDDALTEKCGHCGNTLAHAEQSFYFCDPACQEAWHAARSTPDPNAREPYYTWAAPYARDFDAELVRSAQVTADRARDDDTEPRPGRDPMPGCGCGMCRIRGGRTSFAAVIDEARDRWMRAEATSRLLQRRGMITTAEALRMAERSRAARTAAQETPEATNPPAEPIRARSMRVTPIDEAGQVTGTGVVTTGFVSVEFTPEPDFYVDQPGVAVVRGPDGEEARIRVPVLDPARVDELLPRLSEPTLARVRAALARQVLTGAQRAEIRAQSRLLLGIEPADPNPAATGYRARNGGEMFPPVSAWGYEWRAPQRIDPAMPSNHAPDWRAGANDVWALDRDAYLSTVMRSRAQVVTEQVNRAMQGQLDALAERNGLEPGSYQVAWITGPDSSFGPVPWNPPTPEELLDQLTQMVAAARARGEQVGAPALQRFAELVTVEVSRAAGQLAPILRAVGEAFLPTARAIGDVFTDLARSLTPETLRALGLSEVEAAQLDVQQEGAGDSAMQRAIRAKRHRNAGPARRERKDRHRRERPNGQWFQL